jgi:exonuclease VII small subunit
VYQAKLEKILKTFSPVRLVQKETVEKLAQIEHKLKDLLSFRSEQPVDVPQEVPADNAEKKNLIAAMKSKEKIYENAAATLRSCEKKRIAAETTLASATSMYAKAAVESEEANRRAAEVNGKKKGGAISKEAAKLQKKTDDLRGNMNAAKTACDDATLAACEARNKETEAKRVLDAAAVQVENLAPMSARSETSDSSFSLSDSVSNGVARSQSGEKTNVSAFVSACSEYKNVSSSMTNHVKSPVFDCETGVDTVAFNMAVSVVNRCILLVNWHLLAQEGEKFQWGHAELKEKEVTIQGLYDRLSLSDIIDLAAASVFDLRKFYGRIIDRAIHADIIFTQMKTIQASASMLVQIAEESRKSGFIVTPSQENKALFNRNAEHLEDCVSALEAIENSITHAHYAIVNSKVDEHKKTLESFDGLLYALARTKYFFANK